MNTATAVAVPPAYRELEDQLKAGLAKFGDALPAHMNPENFIRVAMTAIGLNPKLLGAERRSLLNSLMQCAHEGLRPDGKEAVLVIYRDRERGEIVQYQRGIYGIRKLVQQSGEIGRFEQTIVYENDEFDYQLGDQPFIKHKPAVSDRGDPIMLYSIAQFREDGTLSREVMSADEIQKIRGISRAKDGPAWSDFWGEMARKVVAKRHAKILPMSVTARDAIKDDDEQFGLISMPTPSGSASSRPRLADRLDALTPTSGAGEKRRRGRPKADPPAAPIGDQQEIDEIIATAPIDEAFVEHPDRADDWPGGPRKQDYEIGRSDAEAGRTACLNTEIKSNPRRFSEWQRGFKEASKAK